MVIFCQEPNLGTCICYWKSSNVKKVDEDMEIIGILFVEIALD